jgi:hypothetical protein
MQAYVDREASLEERTEVERHLSACPACAEELERAQGLVALVTASAEERELPPFFEARLKTRIRDLSAAPRPAFAPFRLAWVAAGVIAVALTGFFVFTRIQQAPPGMLPGIAEVREKSGAVDETGEETHASSRAPVVASGRAEEEGITAEFVYPEEDGLVQNGEIDVAAAFYPPVSEGKIRLLLDDRDVTDLSDVTSDYVMFSSPWELESGYHLLTLRVSDTEGGEKEQRRLFYVL